MGPARAGQLAHVWADEFTVHVLIGGQLVKTVPSSLSAEDLATLKMRGAAPAGPPPAAPAPAKAGALPGGTVIEVDRTVDGNGDRRPGRSPAQDRRRAGPPPGHPAARRAPHPRHLRRRPGQDPAQPRSRPPAAASYAAPGSPRPRCPPPAPGRSASSARSPKTASSWSPASGCASAPPTPARSSPSTSRTPTSASPATAPRSPCTPAPSSGPSPGGKPRSTPRKPSACPASPEPVSHVVSRNCQATPETTHHTQAKEHHLLEQHPSGRRAGFQRHETAARHYPGNPCLHRLSKASPRRPNTSMANGSRRPRREQHEGNGHDDLNGAYVGVS